MSESHDEQQNLLDELKETFITAKPNDSMVRK